MVDGDEKRFSMGGKCEIDGQIGYRGRLEYSIERDRAGTKRRRLYSSRGAALRVHSRATGTGSSRYPRFVARFHPFVARSLEKLEIRPGIDTLPLPRTHRHRENLPPTLPFSDEKKRKRKRKGKNRHRWRRRFTCSSDGSREGMKFPIRTLAANFSRVDV